MTDVAIVIDETVESVTQRRLSESAVTKEDIICLLKDESYTDDWSLEKLKSPVWREFFFWSQVLRCIEEEDLSLKENLTICLKNFDVSVSSISSFVRKIRNRICLIEKRRDFTLGYESVFSKDSICSVVGPFCLKYGITLEWLKNPSPIENISIVTVGLIIELRKLRVRYCYTLHQLSIWIKCILCLDYVPDLGFIRRQVDSLYKKQLSLSRSNKKDQQEFLETQYVPPKFRNVLELSKMKKPKCENGQKNKMPKSDVSHVSTMNKLETKLKKEREARRKINLEYYQLKKKHFSINRKYTTCSCKLSLYSTRNINKKLKRRQNKIKILQEENSKHIEEKKFLKEKCEVSKKSYKQTASLLRYYKEKNKICKSSNVVENNQNHSLNRSNEQILSLKNQVCYLQNENLVLKDELDEVSKELMQSRIVQTFQNGKYVDTVREVYAVLLSMNVGVKNVEIVIKTVLEKLGGLKVDRLPKKTFSELMMIEAKALAQIQAPEAMLKSSFNTLHTDGTKRMGREFGGVQIGTESGQFSLGISEMVTGNTDNFLKMIDQILSDMSHLISSDSNFEENKSNLLLSIKNLMTDRHVVNSCLKTCLEKIRLECLPDNNDSNEDIKKKWLNLMVLNVIYM